MPLASIKEEFKNKRVAFNGSAALLGKRNDYDDLAIIALESKDKTLLRLFDKLPPLAVLKKVKTDQQLKKIAGVAVKKGNKAGM